MLKGIEQAATTKCDEPHPIAQDEEKALRAAPKLYSPTCPHLVNIPRRRARRSRPALLVKAFGLANTVMVTTA